MPAVNCPTCKKAIEWSTDNKFRPFCCERCKLIDLGEWASENRVIKGQTPKGLPPELAQQLENFDEFDLGENDFFHE
ncbi:DNA gyrase inhibitor YacG [Catenovulum maritimum]|uniref:DNA gyrase inhibitor YacG n=1 Tax=Catenovulum maritimum TaxID=1513271 RepID=A0A0J8GZH0_9ALTE|nr:DNA gyrase inhibitor YacG [Catenovulum maritimum]KMT66123.1 hypothetical protein XM47_04930 [Catenovulum maritimum]